MTRALELLAPAKDLACGIAAIDHGADAVYIGAQRFGARASAGNSVADIAQLCDYAHQFQAKVYVTVNTIIYDDELEATRELLQQLADVKVDAILVQDMALLTSHLQPSTSNLPPPTSNLPPPTFHLHASTQTDNRSADKVRWLRDLGFSRVVLARELTIDEIRAIHEAVPDVELEVFVHGALCVSYSGLCYASQHCFGRSANRGECAQFCRMAFDLVDADGQVVEHNRHLLSLKDMCQIDNLEALAEAGATSFKIEGRLKDMAYVKNVTAAYSERLNQIVRRHPDRYHRASAGRCTYTFTPNLQKTFNRGYTTYFANGRRPDIASFDTPKAIGEFVGTVKELRRDSFNVAGTASFANGDGLCFFSPLAARAASSAVQQSPLTGFRVNRVEGNRLYPQHMPEGLRPGIRLYRNNDQEFERLMAKASAVRKVRIPMSLEPTSDGFRLCSGDVAVEMTINHQRAEKPQHDNIVRQLTKLGNTPYECSEVMLADDFDYFIPSSQLAELRRLLVEALSAKNGSHKAHEPYKPHRPYAPHKPYAPYTIPYLYNIANHEAARFYGVSDVSAYELAGGEGPLMQCRHCLRYSLGYCAKHGGQRPTWREPLSLRLGDGRLFRLEFDCKNCQMNVYAATR